MAAPLVEVVVAVGGAAVPHGGAAGRLGAVGRPHGAAAQPHADAPVNASRGVDEMATLAVVSMDVIEVRRLRI